MMNRTLIAAALTSLLAVAACDRDEPTRTATAPVPAESIANPTVPAETGLSGGGLGSVRIGMSAAEVEAIWGPGPAMLDNTGPEACNEYHPSGAPKGVNVMIQGDRLTRISLIRDAAEKTDRGFGVGDTGAAIKAAYGGAIIAQPAKYNPAPAEDLIAWASGGSTSYVTDPAARGVRYEVGTDGKVSIIHAGDPSIQLVEGCH